MRRFGWLLVIAAELAWLGWFLTTPLPNANDPLQDPAKLKNTRGLLLMRLAPEIVPGVTFQESLLGGVWEKTRRVENLSERLPLFAAALWIATAGTALGEWLLRAARLRDRFSIAERLPLAFGVGMSCLSGLTLILGKLGALGAWPARGLLIALTVAGALALLSRPRSRSPQSQSSPLPSAPTWRLSSFWPLAVALPFAALMILGAMTPPFDFDSLEYHLQGPKEYFQAGRIGFLPHNVYTSMPFQTEMGTYLGMLVLNDWRQGALVGQVLTAMHAPMAAWLIGLTTARWSGSTWAGSCAAAIYLTTPWIYRLGTITYVEGPLCFFHAALVWLAARSWDEPSALWRPRYWLPIGILAGGAMACKYPALISAVLPFGVWSIVEAVKRGDRRAPAWFAAGVALMMTPWLAKNAVETGNPVYPLAWSVFGGADWNAALDAKWSRAHGRQPIEIDRLAGSIIDVAGRSDWQSPLYLAFAPFAAAFASTTTQRRAWALAGLIAWIFLTWWLLTHRLDRFWLPLLPAAAVLAGVGVDALRKQGWPGVGLAAFVGALGVASNFAHSITPLTSWNDWNSSLSRQYEEVPRVLNPTLARTDDELPTDAKILLVGQASVFHIKHPIVYNTVFDFETIQTICEDQPPSTIRRTLRNLGVTHIYVDWKEITRYRQPGNYGFTDFVTPELFQRLTSQGVLSEPRALDEEGRQLFEVAGGN